MVPAEVIQYGLPDRWHRGLGWWAGASFFPPRRCEALGLKEGVGHHRHQRVLIQSGPGAALEVVEAEFLLHLLVGLFADPAGLDHGGELLEGRIGGQV